MTPKLKHFQYPVGTGVPGILIASVERIAWRIRVWRPRNEEWQLLEGSYEFQCPEWRANLPEKTGRIFHMGLSVRRTYYIMIPEKEITKHLKTGIGRYLHFPRKYEFHRKLLMGRSLGAVPT